MDTNDLTERLLNSGLLRQWLTITFAPTGTRP